MPDIRNFKIAIFGAGPIGTALASALVSIGGFDITMVEQTDELLDPVRALKLPVTLCVPATPEKKKAALAEQDLVVAAVPDHAVAAIAALAADVGVNYLDFSRVTRPVVEILEPLASRRAVLTGCGASPGLVDALAADLVRNFPQVTDLVIRVGALPRFSTNRLGYSRIWNIDGLVDEYLLPSAAIRAGQRVTIPSLHEYERFTIGGADYEAFTTSGGIGDLARMPATIQNVTFKTIRYPGHLDYMQLLLDDLDLRNRPYALKMLLNNGLPVIEDDIVLMFITARGQENGQKVERSVFKKLSPARRGTKFNALTQVAAGYAAHLVTLLRQGALPAHGFIEHGQIPLDEALESVSLAPFLSSRSSPSE
ncbi:saccharopine dehydrogenase C-terminal domain-containing protein [Xanthobacteraceae bacterium Astr-EGSB]|uniref:saccharopine dehydrogenase family protein n=1 Tax=Astrobacterium formosum TaxID=3069710 RepID=UPI0027B01C53|nr:saccharopine dehydrogenase C-terminal domain-containing protein [Xanthobacteraceae bacterium Astr-EGSB]